jgi:hypothetical protein
VSRTSIIRTPILRRGRHRHPRGGACLLEFAATLPGGPWADHPVHVQPALAALARRVNDHTSDAARRALLPWAAWLVGTASEHDLDAALAARAGATALRHADPATAARLAPALTGPGTARGATRRLIRLAVATLAGAPHPDEELRALLADAVNITRDSAGLDPVVVDSTGFREWPATQPIEVELRIPDGSESAFYFCTALPGGWPPALAEAWSARADELRRRGP